MPRPTKPVDLVNKHLTNEEKEARKQGEEKLKGKSDCIKPSSYLSKKQKEIFKKLVSMLEESDILSNLDIYLLDEAAVTIDRMQALESDINTGKVNMFDQKVTACENMLHKKFGRYMNELGISPQARSKMANMAAQNKTEDPLKKLLAGDADEDD